MNEIRITLSQTDVIVLKCNVFKHTKRKCNFKDLNVIPQQK